MGKKIASQFEECVRNKKITRLAAAGDLIEKELRVAKTDLAAARKGFEHQLF